MNVAQKKTRKQLLKQDDAFIHAAGKSAVWIKSHRALVILGSVAVVVLIGGLWGAIEYVQHRDLRASNLYLQALAIKDAQVVAEAEAKPDATPPTFASDKAKNEAARAAFDKVIAKASGSGVAEMARFYVADLDADLGDTDKALAAFEALASELSPHDSLYFLAVERTAYLHEGKGDVDAAIAAWQRLAAGKEAFYADEALYQMARLRAQKGDNKGARELLERFEKEFTDSSVQEQAKELLAQLGPEQPKATAEAQPTTEATP